MLRNLCENIYGLPLEGIYSESEFRSGYYHYKFIENFGLFEEEINERSILARNMIEYGEIGVWDPVLTKNGDFLVSSQTSSKLLLRKPVMEYEFVETSGRNLAMFHLRGRNLVGSESNLNRLGKWQQYWEHGLAEFEKFWFLKWKSEDNCEFTQMFIEYMPYFSGCAENAIQCLVDIEFDNMEMSGLQGTLTYERFGLEHFRAGKDPLEWVYDHPVRDVAEWIRNCFYKYSPEEAEFNVLNFITSYEQVIILDPVGIRLLLARLLWPLSFFDIVHGYYDTNSKRKIYEPSIDNLVNLISNTRNYEIFITRVMNNIVVGKNEPEVRIPEWLIK